MRQTFARLDGTECVMLDILAWTLAAIVTVVSGIFSLECLAGLRPLRTIAGEPGPVDVAVLVPAHNEATGIARSLAALTAVLPRGAHVLVVADNCSDATADLARSADVTVVERTDPLCRGKGFALAFGRNALADSPPAAVIVIDADCTPAAGTLRALAAMTIRLDRPLQAVNLLRSDATAPPMVQISSFAFLVKNLVRQRGSARLGGVGILGGTGMAMPWHLFAEAPLATADIVEDLALGIWATRRGHPPLLLEGAHVESDAAARDDTLGQRARWEHGFLATARRHVVPLIAEGMARRSRSMLWLGLHLCVPPLAMLMTTIALVIVILAALAVLGASLGPLTLTAASAAFAGVAIILAWAREGRGTLTRRALLYVPIYVVWKLPIYLRLLVGRRAGWRRTRRDGEPSDRPSV